MCDFYYQRVLVWMKYFTLRSLWPLQRKLSYTLPYIIIHTSRITIHLPDVIFKPNKCLNQVKLISQSGRMGELLHSQKHSAFFMVKSWATGPDHLLLIPNNMQIFQLIVIQQNQLKHFFKNHMSLSFRSVYHATFSDMDKQSKQVYSLNK